MKTASLPIGEETAKPRIGIWQIAMLFLCIYVLGALFVETVFTLQPRTTILLAWVDDAICVLFIGDFFYNLVTAKNKWQYLKWGWIDLLSSVPTFQFLRWGRFIRVVRIVRLCRAVRSTKVILQILFNNRAQGTFAAAILISFVLVIFSSIAILNCETSPDANIKTAADALWWSFATITTVGYGDKYPVTTTGRIIAAVMMTAGVGFFGTLTAYIATVFLMQGQKEEKSREMEILAGLQEIKQQLDRIEGVSETSDNAQIRLTKGDET